MKKIVLFILLVLVPISVIADEVILPYNVIISDPLTDKADRKAITIRFDDNSAVLTYNLLSASGGEIVESYSFVLDGQAVTDLFGGVSNALLFKNNVSGQMNIHLKTQRDWQAK